MSCRDRADHRANKKPEQPKEQSNERAGCPANQTPFCGAETFRTKVASGSINRVS